MSARILYSLSDNKSEGGGGGGGGAQKQHIGCMNGIFHLLDRSHFLSGGRHPAGSIRKRLDTGKDGNCDAEEDTMSIKSTGKVLKAAANERHRLSTDSSRSSPSSSCNSSSFSSSLEDNRLAKIEPLMEQRANDLPRLQRLNNSGENPLPRSGVMTYVDSPRPVLPSRADGERKSAVSVSLRDFHSLQRPRNFVDSPRFSYDGRESRDVIKSNVRKLREQPRHSLDSKKSSLSSSSLRDLQQQEEPGRCKLQSSIVAKLMGLEAASNAHSSSKSQMRHGRNNSVNALDPFSVSSRTTNKYPLQSPTLSVYGELDKRLERIKFKRSGKDLRALKQILEATQKSTRLEDGKKNIHRVVPETSNIGRSDFMAKFKSLAVVEKAAVGFGTELIPLPRAGTSELPQINSSNQRRSDALPPRSSSSYTRANRSSETTHVTYDRRLIVKRDCMGSNIGNSRAQLQSPRRSNQPGRQPREPTSPCRTPKSKVSHDLIIGNSIKPIEPRSALFMQSDDVPSRDDDSEVSSYHVTRYEQKPKKVQLLPNEVNDSPFKCGIIQAEQPSPVSVLDLTYLEDESLSTAKMMSENFKDGESTRFCKRDQSLQTPAEIIPDKKHDHTCILQSLSSTGLLGNPGAGNLMTVQLHSSGTIATNLFPTLEPDKPSNDLFMGQSQSNRGKRIQRKLLFDVIDEIMVQKLASDNKKDRVSPCCPAVMKTGQEQLLQGLCSKISQLQADIYEQDIDDDNNDYIKSILHRDMHCESQTWKVRFDDSNVVLDIERLIFKDLVTEMVTSQVVGLRNGLTSYFCPMAFV